MDFSEKMPFSIPCEYSPCGEMLATVQDSKLLIRDSESLEVLAVFKNEGVASKILWSPDSKFIMCPQYKRGLVQIYSMDDKQWKCRISEGIAGIAAAAWAPSCRHVLTTQDFQLQLTIWSLTEEKRWIIKSPKFSNKCQTFSHDGKFLAVVERKDFHDYIGIYHCDSWQLVRVQRECVLCVALDKLQPL